MTETLSVKLPYAAGIQLRRLAEHYQMPMTAVMADLIRRESKDCGIPLAQELDILFEENGFVLDIFGLRLPRLQDFEVRNFAIDLKRIAEKGGGLLQSDADVDILRRGSGVLLKSPDGTRSMSSEVAKRIATEILDAVKAEQ